MSEPQSSLKDGELTHAERAEALVKSYAHGLEHSSPRTPDDRRKADEAQREVDGADKAKAVA